MSANPELRPAKPPQPVMPPVTELGVIGWLKKNLFSSWYNTLLTLVTLLVLYRLGGGLLSWVLFEAKWAVVGNNLQVLMVGGYPGDQVWRVWTVLALAAFWSGVTWGGWARMNRMGAIGLGVALLLLQLLPLSLSSRLWVAGAILLIPAGFLVGSMLSKRRGWLIFLWGPLFVVGILMLGGGWMGLPAVEPSRWNGLMLTLLLAVTGIVACFPIGVLLALGRQSSLPAIRIVSITYIEVIRGVPLVTILFMGSLVIPLFLPEGIRIQDVIRAFIGITLFEAAYMAENIRGGLQALSRGQTEAAQALGLRGWQTILLIQLPQALRAVIPAMVGQFIALLKDTSLISIIGLAEFTFIAKGVLRHPDNVRFHFEIYLFVAFVYWLLCYSLAVASRRLEKKLGVGER